MSIPAKIQNISQEFDLQTGEQANYCVLALPNGEVHRALISEETAQQIVALFIQQGKRPTSQPIPSTPPNPTVYEANRAKVYEEDDEEETIFGGSQGDEELYIAPPPFDRDEDGVQQA